jgi:hypothetical protein
MQEQMGDAVRRQLPGTSIEPVYDAVMGAFHRTNLLFAYAAAEELATDGKIAPQIPPQGQRRLIGGCYDEFRDTLARIAPASTPAGATELMAIGEDLALVLYEWLHHIGSHMYDRDGIGKWFEVMKRVRSGASSPGTAPGGRTRRQSMQRGSLSRAARGAPPREPACHVGDHGTMRDALPWAYSAELRAPQSAAHLPWLAAAEC